MTFRGTIEHFSGQCKCSIYVEGNMELLSGEKSIT